MALESGRLRHVLVAVVGALACPVAVAASLVLQVIDEPERVVAAIFDHYETRGFGPLPEEHELLLNL